VRATVAAWPSTVTSTILDDGSACARDGAADRRDAIAAAHRTAGRTTHARAMGGFYLMALAGQARRIRGAPRVGCPPDPMRWASTDERHAADPEHDERGVGPIHRTGGEPAESRLAPERAARSRGAVSRKARSSGTAGHRRRSGSSPDWSSESATWSTRSRGGEPSCVGEGPMCGGGKPSAPDDYVPARTASSGVVPVARNAADHAFGFAVLSRAPRVAAIVDAPAERTAQPADAGGQDPRIMPAHRSGTGAPLS